MFAETGIGVCYIKSENIKEMKAYKVGGGHKKEGMPLNKASELLKQGKL